MYSEEEKKAIKYFYNLRTTIDESNMLFDEDINIKCGEETIKQITIILNLIEKQSKEMEILNKNMNLLREQNISYKQSIHGLKEMNKIINKKLEDKIKAKIEEWDKDIKWNNADDHYYAIKMMQSLLEKE